jgi:hypothetical protein
VRAAPDQPPRIVPGTRSAPEGNHVNLSWFEILIIAIVVAFAIGLAFRAGYVRGGGRRQ